MAFAYLGDSSVRKGRNNGRDRNWVFTSAGQEKKKPSGSAINRDKKRNREKKKGIEKKRNSVEKKGAKTLYVVGPRRLVIWLLGYRARGMPPIRAKRMLMDGVWPTS